MIGIVCGESERAAVAEFFELLKTPWQFHGPGDDTAVLLVTAQAPEIELDGRTVLAFGSERTWVDDRFGVSTLVRFESGMVDVPGKESALPLEAGALALGDESGEVLARLSCGAATAIRLRGQVGIVRCGYDLFAEVRRLLEAGQSHRYAPTPTLDLHVELVRRWLVQAGRILIEIPPVRYGHPYAVCLTHDIDFLALRRHRCDRTLLGFIYRATVGSMRDLFRGRSNVRKLVRNWAAVASLPLVHLGLVPDPWRPFASYTESDPAPSTFFVVPFRGRDGVAPPDGDSRGRAVAYDVDDVAETLRKLAREGYEVAVHGIDGWHSSDAARNELERVWQAVGVEPVGTRMHWLYGDVASSFVLEQAGYEYDATSGWNEAVGFRAGTAQAFRPLNVERLLKLPLHIQDTTLFYPTRLNLSEDDAWRVVEPIQQSVRELGGVLTLSWHDRSLAPERLWGRFYRRVLDAARDDDAWFGSARDVVGWFRYRRSVCFGATTLDDGSVSIELHSPDEQARAAGLMVRVHVDGAPATDVPWQGETRLEIPLPRPSRRPEVAA